MNHTVTCPRKDEEHAYCPVAHHCGTMRRTIRPEFSKPQANLTSVPKPRSWSRIKAAALRATRYEDMTPEQREWTRAEGLH
jgi:hypothetical protein